ncbi:Gfo/Idh/MocA family protein [Jatrophihabitans sp. DSM 45814]
MSTPAQLRAAVLGFGFAGRIFHAPFLAAAGIDVAAISTSNAERAAQASKEYPEAEVVASAQEILGREDIDLIVVATPNSSHTELAVAALESGHDVVVDKPFAPTVAEAELIINTAENTGGILSVFQSRRYDSDFRTVRSVLDSGDLGQLFRFESRYERWRPAVQPNWRESGDPAEAGGLLFDLGAHLIDQFIVLFGVPQSVYAEVHKRRPGAAVDDDVFLSLTSTGNDANPIIGHLWMSAVAADAGPRFRLLGTEGGFVKSGMDPQENALLAGQRPVGAPLGSSPEWGAEPKETYGRIGAGDSWRTVESKRGDYADFYRQLAAAIQDGSPVPVDPADSLAGLHVIAAAQRSAQSGRAEVVG